MNSLDTDLSMWTVCFGLLTAPFYHKYSVFMRMNLKQRRNENTVSFLLTDPEVHPQNEEYWGHVNPIGPRACYDEGKRVAETMCYAYMKQVCECGAQTRRAVPSVNH